jgi:tRNA (cytidine/uridine-2'-O-)-methyltransferase
MPHQPNSPLFHVVLFEPEIPPNTGNVIRLCANTGAGLHLVQPLGFQLDDKNLRRSGLDYHDLADVTVHADLQTCLSRLAGARVFAVETGGGRLYSDVEFRTGDVFLFGPETRGLPQAVLAQVGLDNILSIPMQPGSRSINLSNTVALVVYEAWRQQHFAGQARA